jgi:hypothetical protein
MQWINSTLVICGDGNFMKQVKELIVQYKVADKVQLKGMLPPDALWEISLRARIGITIIENTGLNQYLSLPNKFFDYIHTGTPQVAMNYPEYAKINRQFEVAVLLESHEPKIIAGAINNLLVNDVLYSRFLARKELNWEREEKKLLQFYKTVFET